MKNKKNIIVIGTGEIGRNITSKLLMQGHDVAVIEKDRAKVNYLSNNYDVKVIHGNGCLPKNLKAAGAETADAIIALSSVDEVNMVACQVAYSLFDIKIRMARIYNHDYLASDYKSLFNDEDLPVDYIISPEQQVADRIINTLSIPKALDVMHFIGKKQTIFALKLTKDFKYFNYSLEQVKSFLPYDFRAMLISRNDRSLIPNKADHFEEGDIVYFLTESKTIMEFLGALGFATEKENNVIIIGGGNTGYAVAKGLEEKNYHLKLIEKDVTRANYLADALQKTAVINVDAMDFKMLEDANISDMDIVLNLTDSDEVNSLCSVYEQQMGCQNIYTLIKNNQQCDLTNKMHFAKVITPRNITASKVLRFIREARIYNLYNVQNDAAEIVEVKLSKNSPLNGMSLGQFNSKNKNMKIGCVSNQKQISYSEDAIMHSGDRIIILGLKKSLQEFYNLIEK